MNIGIDIRPLMSPVRTGVGEYTFELLNAIFNQDTEHQYFLLYNSYQNVSSFIPKWEHHNIHYITTHYPNKVGNLSHIFFQQPQLDTLIKNLSSTNCQPPFHLDIFFSPNLNFTSLTQQTKHILTIHDLSFEFFPHFYSTKQRLWHRLVNPQKQCERAHLILTPSESTRQDLMAFYKIPPEKIKVIYPGLSETFKQQLQSPLEGGRGVFMDLYEDGTPPTPPSRGDLPLPPHFILFLGTIEPRKNILALIEAFELFKQQEQQNEQLLTRNYQLLIAGARGWKNGAIFKRIADSVYKNSIHILSPVSLEEKATLYARADLFVYPSFYEGFGFPVLEAFAAEVPVITSNRSSLPEVTNGNALLINPHKPTELAEGMNTLLTQEKIRDRLIRGGKVRITELNWPRAAREWLDTIQNL